MRDLVPFVQWCFSRFLNSTNGNKSLNASYIFTFTQIYPTNLLYMLKEFLKNIFKLETYFSRFLKWAFFDT